MILLMLFLDVSVRNCYTSTYSSMLHTFIMSDFVADLSSIQRCKNGYIPKQDYPQTALFHFHVYSSCVQTTVVLTLVGQYPQARTILSHRQPILTLPENVYRYATGHYE